jgi:type IV pilus assembly protein PilY1
VTRSQLKQRKIVARGTDPATGNPVRAFEQATPNDMADKKGWYVDLDPGERMITSSQFYGSVLIASSIIPSADPCTPGGKGYVNAIDPFTGAALGTPFFTDYGTLTVGEQKIPVGSVDLGIGMPGQALIVGDKLVGGGSGGSGGTLGLTSANPGGSGGSGRVNWRELIRE